MNDERNSDDDLARDIGFALWRSPFRVKRDQGIDAVRSRSATRARRRT
jgi:hypothetical protein